MTKRPYSNSEKVRQEKDDVRRKFGVAIRTHRRRLGYSQEELAERAGLHRTYVTDIENGLRNISLENIRKVANALDVSLSQLFTMVENA